MIGVGEEFADALTGAGLIVTTGTRFLLQLTQAHGRAGLEARAVVVVVATT